MARRCPTVWLAAALILPATVTTTPADDAVSATRGSSPAVSGPASARQYAADPVAGGSPVATSVPRQTGLTRLPPVTAETAAGEASAARAANRAAAGLQGSTGAGQEADGTWHDDGRYLVIQMNGQEFRLVKSDPRPQVHQVQPGGEVIGRLSHKGQPLSHCAVAIVPLKKRWDGYSADRSAEPLSVTTDGNGVYHFTDVPPGAYKLKWRPAQDEGWIRHAEMRPDVRVRANETARVKEVLVSLRTIN